MKVEFTLRRGRSTFAQVAEGNDFNECFTKVADLYPKASCHRYKIIEK